MHDDPSANVHNNTALSTNILNNQSLIFICLYNLLFLKVILIIVDELELLIWYNKYILDSYSLVHVQKKLCYCSFIRIQCVLRKPIRNLPCHALGITITIEMTCYTNYMILFIFINLSKLVHH